MLWLWFELHVQVKWQVRSLWNADQAYVANFAAAKASGTSADKVVMTRNEAQKM